MASSAQQGPARTRSALTCVLSSGLDGVVINRQVVGSHVLPTGTFLGGEIRLTRDDGRLRGLSKEAIVRVVLVQLGLSETNARKTSRNTDGRKKLELQRQIGCAF